MTRLIDKNINADAYIWKYIFLKADSISFDQADKQMQRRTCS